MTDNDPAVELVRRISNKGWWYGSAPEVVATLRTPKGARALFPELAAAVERMRHANLAATAPLGKPIPEAASDEYDEALEALWFTAADLFAVPDRQENP